MVNRFELKNREIPVHISARCERRGIHLLASFGRRTTFVILSSKKSPKQESKKMVLAKALCVVFVLCLANLGECRRLDNCGNSTVCKRVPMLRMMNNVWDGQGSKEIINFLSTEREVCTEKYETEVSRTNTRL